MRSRLLCPLKKRAISLQGRSLASLVAHRCATHSKSFILDPRTPWLSLRTVTGCLERKGVPTLRYQSFSIKKNGFDMLLWLKCCFYDFIVFVFLWKCMPSRLLTEEISQVKQCARDRVLLAKFLPSTVGNKTLNFWNSDFFRIAFKSSLGPPRGRNTFSEPNHQPQTP